MQFTFRTAQEIYFASGARNDLGKKAAQFCDNYAVFIGGGSLKKNGELDKIENILSENGIKYSIFGGISQEPDCEMVDSFVCEAKSAGAKGVIAIGGGSVMDVGKSVAGLINNSGSVRDYLDGVGSGKKLTNDAVPFIAVPTTSGTGSETTNNAVMVSIEEGWKRSIRDDKLLPKLVICDPELVLTLPAKKTAESGMDTLAQLIEAYTSNKANAVSDMCAQSGLMAAASLPRAYEEPNDINARTNMMYASMLSGIAITQGGVTACHGLASGFGGAMGIDHGLACAILLPHIMELNRDACPERYADIAERLTGKRFNDVQEGAHIAVDTVKEWLKIMNIANDFSSYNISESDLDRVMKGSSSSSLSKNPVILDANGWREFVSDLI